VNVSCWVATRFGRRFFQTLLFAWLVDSEPPASVPLSVVTWSMTLLSSLSPASASSSSLGRYSPSSCYDSRAMSL
jgi:hypothetical protein